MIVTFEISCGRKRLLSNLCSFAIKGRMYYQAASGNLLLLIPRHVQWSLTIQVPVRFLRYFSHTINWNCSRQVKVLNVDFMPTIATMQRLQERSPLLKQVQLVDWLTDENASELSSTFHRTVQHIRYICQEILHFVYLYAINMALHGHL